MTEAEGMASPYFEDEDVSTLEEMRLTPWKKQHGRLKPTVLAQIPNSFLLRVIQLCMKTQLHSSAYVTTVKLKQSVMIIPYATMCQGGGLTPQRKSAEKNDAD